MGSQDKTFRVKGDFTFPSSSTFCFFIGEYTEEGLPRPLTQSILVALYDLQGIL